uniref:Glycosyl transferase CAP10 domain-containing protein n=1 Tax=viral metagenome TaxID=1070528 RepID=A0A6C0AZL0_9ZZZZ
MTDDFFISQQVQFMYGNYFNDIINNNIISNEKSDYDIPVLNCFQDNNFNSKKDICSKNRLRDFIYLLKKYWKKEKDGYTITCNWHDNTTYQKFILTHNRVYNSKSQVIFPLVDYHLPNCIKINNDIEFKSKTNKLFWRGSTTGSCDVQNNIRFNIVSKNAHAHPDIDVGFNNMCQRIYLNNKEEFIKLKKEHKNQSDQLLYKFILSMEGNDWASSFPWVLSSNSCPLHNYPFHHESYFFGMGLEPYVHFIPVNKDGSDLVEKFQWCLQNLDKCEEIANNGKKYMEKYQRTDLFEKVMLEFFNIYPKVHYY